MSRFQNNRFFKNDKVICDYHPEASLIEDYSAGNLVCPDCGLVVAERVISECSEWRNFSDKTRGELSRVGGPENPFLPSKGRATKIGYGPKFKAMETYRELNTLHKRISYGSEGSLSNGLRQISLMAARINLPQEIIDRANCAYKQIYDKIEFTRRSYAAKAAACLYLACRQVGVPRTFKEVCSVSEVGKKEIGRCYCLMIKVLKADVKALNSTDFMSRFCSYLDIAPKTQNIAKKIAEKASSMDVVNGRSPISVAAASIYMASQSSEKTVQLQDIGRVAGVAEGTIRQSYKLLLPYVTELLPEALAKNIQNCLPAL